MHPASHTRTVFSRSRRSITEHAPIKIGGGQNKSVGNAVGVSAKPTLAPTYSDTTALHNLHTGRVDRMHEPQRPSPTCPTK
jgi:hypothetical protein